MSLSSLSQTQRVLALLRARGTEGITAVDFALPNVVDSGKPIMRVAARIKDLRDDGFPIIDGGRRGTVSIYVLDDLVEEQPDDPPAPVGASDDALQLFAPEHQARSAYDEAA